MRHTVRGCLPAFSLAGLLLAGPLPVRAEPTELDQFEDKCVMRAAERTVRMLKSDRAVWLKELEAAYPGKVVAATTDEEYLTWFDLLVGKNENWRKAEVQNPQVGELFDKVVQRLELGPVPSITREEFKKYARRVLREGNPPREGEGRDPNEDADKAFRVLDRNGNGEIDDNEYTSGLKDEKIRADADGNGRINKEEYRGYFRKKVTAKADALIAAKSGENGKNGKPVAAKAGSGLPDWFTAYDLDKDGQISLFEWRKADKATELFQEMDLNSDGLLTKEEYLRYVRLKAIELNQKRREEENP